MSKYNGFKDEVLEKSVDKLGYDAFPQEAIAPQAWSLLWANGNKPEKQPCFGFAMDVNGNTIQGTCSMGVFVHAFKEKALKKEDVCEHDETGWYPSENKFMMGFSSGKMQIQLVK